MTPAGLEPADPRLRPGGPWDRHLYSCKDSSRSHFGKSHVYGQQQDLSYSGLNCTITHTHDASVHHICLFWYCHTTLPAKCTHWKPITAACDVTPLEALWESMHKTSGGCPGCSERNKPRLPRQVGCGFCQSHVVTFPLCNANRVLHLFFSSSTPNLWKERSFSVFILLDR
jgi:hypothetical protein